MVLLKLGKLLLIPDLCEVVDPFLSQLTLLKQVVSLLYLRVDSLSRFKAA